MVQHLQSSYRSQDDAVDDNIFRLGNRVGADNKRSNLFEWKWAICVCVCVCVCATGACNRVITARLWLVAAIIGSPSPSSHFLGSLSLLLAELLGWRLGYYPRLDIHTHISERQQCCLVSGFEEVRAVREIKRKIPKTHTATQKRSQWKRDKQTNKVVALAPISPRAAILSFRFYFIFLLVAELHALTSSDHQWPFQKFLNCPSATIWFQFARPCNSTFYLFIYLFKITEDFLKFIGTGILRRDLFDIGVPRHVLYFFKWILNQGRKEKKRRERERMMKSGLIRESFRWRI